MKKELHIKGMSCQNCVRHVKEALGEIEGIRVVDVDLKKGIATVEGDTINDQALVDAMGKTHYTLKKIK